jgi:hypothetical protein
MARANKKKQPQVSRMQLPTTHHQANIPHPHPPNKQPLLILPRRCPPPPTQTPPPPPPPTTPPADLDLAAPAATATFALKAGVTLNGEAIAVDGKTYLKTSLTGPLYQESSGLSTIDPSQLGGVIDTLGHLLLKPGVDLVKGDDVACGSKQCYTVSADLTAADLGTDASSALDSLPIDLAGATVDLTLRVEKDLPYHLAGVTAVLSQPNGKALTVDVTASKWDEPVTITAPPADQVKPAS